MPEDLDAAALFALLDDEHARALLVRPTEEEIAARRLHEEIDASLAEPRVELTAEGFEASVDRRGDVADRFTRVREGL